MTTSSKTDDFLAMFSVLLAFRINNAEETVLTINNSEIFLSEYTKIIFDNFVISGLHTLKKTVDDFSDDSELINTKSCHQVYIILNNIIFNYIKKILLFKKSCQDESTLASLDMMLGIYAEIQQELSKLLKCLDQEANSTEEYNSDNKKLFESVTIINQTQKSNELDIQTTVIDSNNSNAPEANHRIPPVKNYPPPQPQSILESALGDLPAEYRDNPIVRVIYSCIFFLLTWMMIAFFFWIIFVVLPSLNNTGMKKFLYDCSTLSIDSYSSETCTTKDWVSFLLNISSFLFTAVGINQPEPNYK